jgi:C-terminal processing protease CtpA/Prc
VFSLGRYLTQPTPFVKFTGGSVQTPGHFTWSELLKVGESNVSGAYGGKVVVLVNESTQSQAEYTTMAFRRAPGALVIGITTAAADGNVSAFELPGGRRTMVSGIGVNYPDGRETQRVGVGVDIEVNPTRKGIQQGRDELLEKAAALIRAGY